MMLKLYLNEEDLTKKDIISKWENFASFLVNKKKFILENVILPKLKQSSLREIIIIRRLDDNEIIEDDIKEVTTINVL